MIGAADILMTPPKSINQEHIDGMPESARAEGTPDKDNTSPPTPLLKFSLLVSNRLGRRISLDPDRAYLNNCATFNQTTNPDILTNIFESPDTLFAYCNSVTTATNTKGNLGSLECWLNKNGIANLLSVPELTKLGYIIKLENRLESPYQVTPKGQIQGVPATVPFKLDEKGLPYIDVKQVVVFAQLMVPTVHDNMEGCTKQERQKATLARKMQGLLGHMSANELDFLVRKKTSMTYHSTFPTCKIINKCLALLALK